MKYDVVALGELLIDFTGSGSSAQGNPLFEANPGGAPGNVMAMLTKLGRKTAFIGKVGNDMFGRMLLESVESCGIGTEGIITDDEANTTLAFVKNFEDGDREFSFFRKPGADTLLTAAEVDAGLLENAEIFHFGTLSLTNEPSRGATYHAVNMAKNAGALISFDPNLRPPLWSDLENARKQMDWGCRQCDILKIADEELIFLTDEKNLENAVSALRETYPDIKIFFVTKGRGGAEGFWGEAHFCQPAFIDDNTVDTTGAGDTFCGSCLSFILDIDINKPDENKLSEMMKFASAAASRITTRKGALLCMPESDEILSLLSKDL